MQASIGFLFVGHKYSGKIYLFFNKLKKHDQRHALFYDKKIPRAI